MFLSKTFWRRPSNSDNLARSVSSVISSGQYRWKISIAMHKSSISSLQEPWRLRTKPSWRHKEFTTPASTIDDRISGSGLQNLVLWSYWRAPAPNNLSRAWNLCLVVTAIWMADTISRTSDVWSTNARGRFVGAWYCIIEWYANKLWEVELSGYTLYDKLQTSVLFSVKFHFFS